MPDLDKGDFMVGRYAATSDATSSTARLSSLYMHGLNSGLVTEWDQSQKVSHVTSPPLTCFPKQRWGNAADRQHPPQLEHGKHRERAFSPRPARDRACLALNGLDGLHE